MERSCEELGAFLAHVVAHEVYLGDMRGYLQRSPANFKTRKFQNKHISIKSEVQDYLEESDQVSAALVGDSIVTQIQCVKAFRFGEGCNNLWEVNVSNPLLGNCAVVTAQFKVPCWFHPPI